MPFLCPTWRMDSSIWVLGAFSWFQISSSSVSMWLSHTGNCYGTFPTSSYWNGVKAEFLFHFCSWCSMASRWRDTRLHICIKQSRAHISKSGAVKMWISHAVVINGLRWNFRAGFSRRDKKENFRRRYVSGFRVRINADHLHQPILEVVLHPSSKSRSVELSC